METATPPAVRYAHGAIALHWIIALLIGLNFVIAWMAEDLPREEMIALMANHKAIGITVLVLTLARIAWRLVHRPPPLLETLKTWEAAGAKVVHGLFYFLMLAIPLAGWSLSSAFSKGQPVSYFGLFDIPALPVGHDKPTVGMFGQLHEITAVLMLALVVIHVAAAVKHQFVDRDETMRRMVPWGR